MNLKISFLWRCAAILFLSHTCSLAQATPSNWYPRDANGHWLWSAFSGGAVINLRKQVRTDLYNYSERMVFNKVGLSGVLINGVNYNFSQLTVVSEVFHDLGPFLRFLGSYTIGSDQINTEFRFNKDGSFTLKTDIVTSTTGPRRAYLRLDYDINGHTNDTHQFVNNWSAVHYWDAHAVEHTRGFGSSPLYGSSIERNAWCRLADAGDPQTQMFVILHPSGTTVPGVNITFKAYTSNETTPPAYNPYNTIQSVSSDAQQPGSYPTTGSDQVVYLGLQLNSSGTNTYSVTAGGKLFIRPGGRPLKINFYAQTGTANPNTNTVVALNRTFETAISDLTNDRNIYNFFTNQSGAQGDTCSWNNQLMCLTSAQIHQLMLEKRAVNSGVVYSQDSRDNFRDYTIDFLTVNNDWGGGNATGLFFDHNLTAQGGHDTNNVRSEGAVAFYPRMASAWPADGLFPGASTAQLLSFNALHEIAHVIGAHHQWARCDPNVGTSYYGTCQNSRVVNERHTLEEPNIAGTNMLFNPQFIQWYQQGPESWIKPGLYRGTWNGKRRNFIQTGGIGTVLPNNPAWTQDP